MWLLKKHGTLLDRRMRGPNKLSLTKSRSCRWQMNCTKSRHGMMRNTKFQMTWIELVALGSRQKSLAANRIPVCTDLCNCKENNPFWSTKIACRKMPLQLALTHGMHTLEFGDGYQGRITLIYVRSSICAMQLGPAGCPQGNVRVDKLRLTMRTRIISQWS